MDFDDTWHPATHPSGAVLPAVLALSGMMSANSKPSGLDFLLAFNVGIEIQGRLLRFSNEAHNIPKRSENMFQSRQYLHFFVCVLFEEQVSTLTLLVFAVRKQW